MVNRLLTRIGLKKTNEVVGVDIGAASIKMCVLQRTKEGSYVLSTMTQRISHNTLAELPRFAGRDQAALKELRQTHAPEPAASESGV